MAILGADQSDSVSRVIPHGKATIRERTIVAVDPDFCKILSAPEKALIGMDLSDLYRTKEGFDQFFAELHRAAAAQTHVALVTSWCRRDGQIARIVVQITPAFENGEEIWYIEASDTTAVHRMAHLPQRHQRILSAILDHSPLGFGLMLLEPSGDRIMGWYNSAMGKIFGYDEDGLLGKSTRLFYEDDAAFKQAGAVLRSQIESRGSGDLTRKMVRRDGSLVDVRVLNIPVHIDNEISLLTIVEDITERVRAEQALQESQVRMDTIIRAAPLGIGMIQDSQIRWCNQAMCELTGYAFEELRGKNARPLFPDDQSFEEQRSKLYKRIDTNSVGSDEVKFVRKDGTTFNAIMRYAKTSPGQENSPVVVTLTDITALREAQIEKEKLERQVHELHKMEAIGQLAGGIAHDFNNMLGGIMGAAEILTYFFDDNADARKYHQIILDSSRRAADLIQKLLTFSRNGSHDRSPVDLHEIIRETFVLLENTIDRRIRIETHLTAEKNRILGDSSLLQNVLLNLAINSVHAMPQGGTITIKTRNLHLDPFYCKNVPFDLRPGEYIQMEVRDTGSGISPENVGRIFEPFFTTKEQGRGTGLGLSMVYGAVQQHQGAITVSSEVASGTTFHILLPVTQTGDTVKPSTSAIKMGHGRILVVDDEEVVRATAKMLLENMGYDVILARDGLEALDMYKRESATIDLILLDMIMPVMNGRDCFAALKQYDPQVRVVLSSGFTGDEDAKTMMADGLRGIIHKPYRSEDLSRIVHMALSP